MCVFLGYVLENKTRRSLCSTYPCGSNRCYSGVSYNKRQNCKFKELHQRTMDREEELKRDYGLVVRRQWQCEWLTRRANDPKVMRFCQSLPFRTPLDPRAALRGGRLVRVKKKTGSLAKCPHVQQVRTVPVVSQLPNRRPKRNSQLRCEQSLPISHAWSLLSSRSAGSSCRQCQLQPTALHVNRANTGVDWPT